MLLFGAFALLATLFDTARLFLQSTDRSIPALLAWGMWTIALVAPLSLAARERGTGRVPGGNGARNYLVLGYGMAVFALRVVEACLK